METPKPQNDCLEYLLRNGCKNERFIPKDEFDVMARDGLFDDGPYIDTFGDGYGQPYRPRRQVFGKLKTGEFVYSQKG